MMVLSLTSCYRQSKLTPYVLLLPQQRFSVLRNSTKWPGKYQRQLRQSCVTCLFTFLSRFSVYSLCMWRLYIVTRQKWFTVTKRKNFYCKRKAQTEQWFAPWWSAAVQHINPSTSRFADRDKFQKGFLFFLFFLGLIALMWGQMIIFVGVFCFKWGLIVIGQEVRGRDVDIAVPLSKHCWWFDLYQGYFVCCSSVGHQWLLMCEWAKRGIFLQTCVLCIFSGKSNQTSWLEHSHCQPITHVIVKCWQREEEWCGFFFLGIHEQNMDARAGNVRTEHSGVVGLKYFPSSRPSSCSEWHDLVRDKYFG